MTLPTSISPGDPGHIGDSIEIATLLGPAAAASLGIAMFAQGLFSARPAAGNEGLYFYATDRGTFYYDTGAAWVALNADSSTLVQTQVLSSSSTVLLTTTTNDIVYAGMTATLPSGWVSMDVVIEGFITLEYVSGTGYRRAQASVDLDTVAQPKIAEGGWEDIASSAVNRPKQLVLMNRATGKTANVTVDTEAWLDSGSSNVSAKNVELTVTKYRRS